MEENKESNDKPDQEKAENPIEKQVVETIPKKNKGRFIELIANKKIQVVILAFCSVCVIAAAYMTSNPTISKSNNADANSNSNPSESKNGTTDGNDSEVDLGKISSLDTKTKQIGSERIIFTEKSDGVTLVYSSDVSGNIKLLHVSKSKSWTSLLDDGKIFISSQSGDDYSLIDLNGNDSMKEKGSYLTESIRKQDYSGRTYNIKLSSLFFLSPNSNNKVVYTDNFEKSNSKKLYVMNTVTKETYDIGIELDGIIPDGRPSAIIPEVWNNDDSIVFVRSANWESLSGTEIFKVNIDDKTVTKISSTEGIAYGLYDFYPKLNMILARNNSISPNPAGFGFDGPGEIFLINASTDMKTSILKSSHVISTNFLSYDATKILYQEKESTPESTQCDEATGECTFIDYVEPRILSTKIYDINSKATQDIGFTDEILYCSPDFKTVLKKDTGGNVSLYNIETKNIIFNLKNYDETYEYIGRQSVD